MSEVVRQDAHTAFLDEQDRRAPRALRLSSLVSTFAFTIFGVADIWLASGSLKSLFAVRAAVIGSLLALIGASFLSIMRPHCSRLAYLEFCIICAGVIAVTVLTGGAESRYHEALCIAFLGYAAFFYSSVPIIFGLIVAAVCSYNLAIVAFSLPLNLPTLIVNNASLAVAAAVAVTTQSLGNRLRFEEFQLRQKESQVAILNSRAETLQLIAEGMAHDIFNPLGFVRGHIYAMLDAIVDLAPNTETAAEAERHYTGCNEAIERVKAAVDMFRNFAGSGLGQSFEPTDLAEIIQRTVQVAGVGGRPALHLHATKKPLLRSGHLEQALLNLIINAQQAGGPSVPLSIETRDTDSGVALRVKDSGPGMSAEVLNKIFLPRFTTKATGSGLGLPMVKRIVEDHGGTIRAESAPGCGATFFIELPVA